MRNPIFIGSFVGFIAFSLPGIFGSGAEPPDDLLPIIIGGSFFGMVGGVVGGLIGIPLFILFRKDSEQDQLERRRGLNIESEKPIKRVLGFAGIALGVSLLAGAFIGFPDWMNFPSRGGGALAVLFICAGWTWLKNETYGK
jgi:hypothetical protein